MKVSHAIARNTPLWVWHDGWWPAVAVEELSGTNETMLVVRLEHGVSVPASVTDVEPRNPALGGTDKPAERGRAPKVDTSCLAERSDRKAPKVKKRLLER